MNKAILIFLLTILLISCASSQNEKISGNPIFDIQNLLKNQNVTADIIDGVKANPRQTELMQKFQISVQENYSWFQKYIISVEKGKPLDYHPNFGISEEEYYELQETSQKIEVTSTGKEKLEIIKTDSNITFKGNGRLKIFDNVIFDIENNQVLYKDYVLPYQNKVDVDNSDNGFKSKWKGYNWAFEDPNVSDETDLSNLKNLNITLVKFTVGKLEKNGKIYMQIQESKVENGVKTVDYQIPILF